MAAEPPAAAGPPDELTERELEVLRLIALGHTNVEIGTQLFLSVRTVESHRAHIQQKTGRSTRAELVRYALDHELVDCSPPWTFSFSCSPPAAPRWQPGWAPSPSPVWATAPTSIRPALWGLTVGLMTVASIVGLLLPAPRRGIRLGGGFGVAVGVAFLLGSRRWLGHHDIHVAGMSGAGARRSALVFIVLLVHSLPEGFAVGTAYASDTADSACS